MGELADEDIERAWLNHPLFNDGTNHRWEAELERRLREGTWTTKTTATIHITEMKESHLKNTITFIERQGTDCAYGHGEEWLPILIAELGRRGLK